MIRQPSGNEYEQPTKTPATESPATEMLPSLLESPALVRFGQEMDQELQALVKRWAHKAAPRAARPVPQKSNNPFLF